MSDSTASSSKLLLILIGGTMAIIILATLFLSFGDDRDPGVDDARTAPESLVDSPQELEPNYETEAREEASEVDE